MSSFNPSIDLLLGLPLDLLPGSSSLSIFLPMYSLSLPFTCPNHLSPASLALSPTHLTLIPIHPRHSQSGPQHLHLFNLSLINLKEYGTTGNRQGHDHPPRMNDQARRAATKRPIVTLKESMKKSS
ncbi:hypothetical protein XENORESO_010643 [Xenotaenia resolanae]|uniref:Uncharacterized protein n=1 Tax=Xenotaenia resolanae TaxID=208358 RepID=A0ABV0WNX4_9TELE